MNLKNEPKKSKKLALYETVIKIYFVTSELVFILFAGYVIHNNSFNKIIKEMIDPNGQHNGYWLIIFCLLLNTFLAIYVFRCFSNRNKEKLKPKTVLIDKKKHK